MSKQFTTPTGEGPARFLNRRMLWKCSVHHYDGILEDYDPSYGGWLTLKEAIIVYEEGDPEKPGKYQRYQKVDNGFVCLPQTEIVAIQKSKMGK